MTSFSLLSIVAALLLVYIPKVIAAKGMKEKDGSYDNHDNRSQQAASTGWTKRAISAHYNAIENFPPFAIAVVVANVAKVSPTSIAICCVVFLVARVCHFLFFLADLASLRSLGWFVGLFATIALYLLPLCS